jgi:hypothetical protein
MHQLNKDLIKFLCLYIPHEDLNILRQCSKYYSIAIGMIYFRDCTINMNNLTKNNKHQFRSFAYKYSLLCNFKNIKTLRQLSYIRTYNNVNSIDFHKTFNKLLWKYLLPVSLQKLKIYFTELKDQIIDKNTFPKNLKEFMFCPNNLIKPSQYFKFLPDSLETLLLLGKCNYDVVVLPPSLKKLFLSCKFNEPFKKNTFPSSLTSLALSGYNQVIEVDVLPASLTKLHLYGLFNQPINEYVLPSSLLELHFDTYFNQSIGKNVLPKSLKILKLSASFNQPIEENVLPASLTKLHFGYKFNQKIQKNILPEGLLKLEFNGIFDSNKIEDALPENLDELVLNGNEHNIIIQNVIFRNGLLKNLKVYTCGYGVDSSINTRIL